MNLEHCADAGTKKQLYNKINNKVRIFTLNTSRTVQLCIIKIFNSEDELNEGATH